MNHIIPPILIEISHPSAINLYELDFEKFQNEVDAIPNVELIDCYCFEGKMLLGLQAKCESINCIALIKRFKNFFNYRWNITDKHISATFENKVHILDYSRDKNLLF